MCAEDNRTLASGAPGLMWSRIQHTRWLVLVAVLILPFIEGVWREGSPMHEGMEWFGHALVLIGAFGRVYCSVYIGGRKSDELVVSGPWSVTRNPLYLFSFIAMVGVGLQSAMLTFTLLLATIFICYYPHVVRREEEFLLHRFGDAYRDYVARVPRWIPDFTKWSDPQEIIVKPRFVFRAALDSMVFFIAFPLLEIVDHLQDAGVLPVLLYLY